MRKSYLYSLLVAVFVIAFAQASMALDLQQARAQGILAEQPNGYVKVVQESAEATALAEQVNTARKQEYQRISAENGQALDVVEKIAAEEIARKLKEGK